MENLMKARRKVPSPFAPDDSPSLAAAYTRLRSLPVGAQVYYAGKYHHGKMPWMEEVNRK